MGKKRDIQDIGIVFGDWKLVGADKLNWELCHRHVTKETASSKANGTAGKVRWHHTGRYYQYNTFANAVEYAIDCDLREGKDVTALAEFLQQYRAMIAEFEKAMAGLLREGGR